MKRLPVILRGKKAASLLLAFVFCTVIAFGSPLPSFAADGGAVKVDIPFTLELTDAAAEQNKNYSFTIEPVDGAPIPDDMATEVVMTEAGSSSFGDLEFTEPGKYKYTISQTTQEETGFTLDDAVYNITVAVNYDDTEEDLKLIYIAVGKDGQAEKPSEICFSNSYTAETEVNPPNEPPEEEPGDEPGTETKKPKQEAPEKPGKSARTGDTMQLGVVMGILIAALAAMVLILVTRRRKNNEQ